MGLGLIHWQSFDNRYRGNVYGSGYGSDRERIIHLARAFNQREGFTEKMTHCLQEFNETLKSGVAAGQRIPEEVFVKCYRIL